MIKVSCINCFFMAVQHFFSLKITDNTKHPFFSTWHPKKKNSIFSSRRWPHLLAAPFQVQMFFLEIRNITSLQCKKIQILQTQLTPPYTPSHETANEQRKKERKKNIIELARIRTWNLLIRSQTRYPLRHEPSPCCCSKKREVLLTHCACALHVKNAPSLILIVSVSWMLVMVYD